MNKEIESTIFDDAGSVLQLSISLGRSKTQEERQQEESHHSFHDVLISDDSGMLQVLQKPFLGPRGPLGTPSSVRPSVRSPARKI